MHFAARSQIRSVPLGNPQLSRHIPPNHVNFLGFRSSITSNDLRQSSPPQRISPLRPTLLNTFIYSIRLAMSSIIGRVAFRASRPLRATGISAGEGADKAAGKEALRTGAKRDPELYVRIPYPSE